uniref:Uncharacterized protein n=1 Tax=Chromera velia CCMP2878 TaxID=1169474 RepID=A0A0G4HS19_9ALVE|eukprot:Cvel_8188.t1-p1 / transcript=Cvel_8188.t1 / gene=Cvel_8188 / organism=Chromera_velia_CCMP2878 / gene_product=hypothetical protein / transcript_product=hypothetical protein / location=Cvel_scaffold446:28820-32957(-) / protein_length=122 / sequence_SO=supercontig / SO=protein_coding / is_pseudo=false
MLLRRPEGPIPDCSQYQLPNLSKQTSGATRLHPDTDTSCLVLKEGNGATFTTNTALDNKKESKVLQQLLEGQQFMQQQMIQVQQTQQLQQQQMDALGAQQQQTATDGGPIHEQQQQTPEQQQ